MSIMPDTVPDPSASSAADTTPALPATPSHAATPPFTPAFTPVAPRACVGEPSRREMRPERTTFPVGRDGHSDAIGEEGVIAAGASRNASEGAPHAREPSKRQSRSSSDRPLTPQDEAIVRAVAQLHFMTAEQVTRLFYARTSLEYVRRKLKALTTSGYLLRLRLPRATPGNQAFVYSLARGGITLVQRAGWLDEQRHTRFRPSEHQEHSALFLEHTLAVNDVLIAALLLARTHHEVEVAELVHERDLRHDPATVRTAAGEVLTVIPDAWLDLHLFHQARMALLLELDRGTEQQRAFQRKVRGLLAYATGGEYERRYHTSSITIVVATTAGQVRAEALLGWIEAALTDQQAQADADLFLVANIAPVASATGPLDPQMLFLTPRWCQPFSSELLPLIDLSSFPRAERGPVQG